MFFHNASIMLTSTACLLQLVELQLGFNQLTGPLPASWSNMSQASHASTHHPLLPWFSCLCTSNKRIDHCLYTTFQKEVCRGLLGPCDPLRCSSIACFASICGLNLGKVIHPSPMASYMYRELILESSNLTKVKPVSSSHLMSLFRTCT